MKAALRKINKYLHFSSGYTGEIKAVCFYRYLAWFLASIFYITAKPNIEYLLRFGVITILFLTTIIILNLYLKYIDNMKWIRLIVIIETIGITLVLIPTGGLESPFFWYALSAALFAASLLPLYFCWVDLIFYITSATVISMLLFNSDHLTVYEMIARNANLIIVFILITFSVQIYSGLTKRLRRQGKDLEEVNSKLSEANSRIKDSMDELMSLYETVATFTIQDGIDELIKAFANCASRLLNNIPVFFWLSGEEDRNSFITLADTNHIMRQGFSETLKNYIDSIKTDIFNDTNRETCIISFEKVQFNALPVNANVKYHGLIGFEKNADLSEPLQEQYKRQIEFLANLSSVILERFRMEEMAERLLINEEQNRIANEMHDNISQKLFSIVCSAHTLTKNTERMPSADLMKQLELLKKTANSAMEELRQCIFKLSSRKKGEQIFCIILKKYLDDFSKLNNIKVSLNIKGDEVFMAGPIKNPLYRIICEACGNSARHGRCGELSIDLDMAEEYIKLDISDNGKGFAVEDAFKGNTVGIGLLNIRNIVRSFGGDLDIRSNEGKGTSISIRIPSQVMSISGSGGMVK